jgi:hypothetical protein
MRLWVILVAALAAFPACADTQFRIRPMRRNDVPRGKGQCDIRLQVDNTAEISVRGDMLFAHTLEGRDPRDDGSECNAPLPDRDIHGFRFEAKESRGEMRLVSEPTRMNRHTLLVYIRDSTPGEGRYHFRLTWDLEGGGYSEAPPPAPAYRRTEVRFRGPGEGVARIGERDMPLLEARVDVDPSGDATVVFQTAGRETLTLMGVVERTEADGLRAVMSGQVGPIHVRGGMFLTVDERGVVRKISMDGGEVRVRWEGR